MEPEDGLTCSNTCAPVISVNVVPSVVQNTLSEVGRVPLLLSKAVQSKLKVPAVLPEKFNNKSTATASGVDDDPVDKKTIASVPLCNPPVVEETKVAEDLVVRVPVVTEVPEPIIPTLLQFAASVPLAKLLVQFAISAKFQVLFPEDIL
jgi:hypothetical protein